MEGRESKSEKILSKAKVQLKASSLAPRQALCCSPGYSLPPCFWQTCVAAAAAAADLCMVCEMSLVRSSKSSNHPTMN